MLHPDRVRLMTRMTIFEESEEGKKALRMSKFYKNDYVRWELMKTILSVTMGYLLILVLIGISGIVRLNGKGKCSVAVLPPQVKPRDLLSAEPGKGLGQVQLGVVVVFSGKLRQGMAAFVPVFTGDRAQL